MKRAPKGQSVLSFAQPKRAKQEPKVITIDDDDDDEKDEGHHDKQRHDNNNSPGIAAQRKVPSAFDTLMSASSATQNQRRERFILTLEDRKFTWQWRAEKDDAVATASAESQHAWSSSAPVNLRIADAPPVQVILQTNLPSYHLTWSPSSSCKLTPSVLKSSLQKAVRRGMSIQAVRIGAELWRASPTEAIRRLMVIIVEDAAVHPAYPALAWLMFACASKNNPFVPGGAHAALYLGIIWDTSRCPWKDTNTLPTTATSSASSAAAAGSPSPVSAACGAIVRSLAARAAFGGMGGDVLMLNKSSRVWHARFESKLDAVTLRGRSWTWLEAICTLHGVSASGDNPASYVVQPLPGIVFSSFSHSASSLSAAAASSSSSSASSSYSQSAPSSVSSHHIHASSASPSSSSFVLREIPPASATSSSPDLHSAAAEAAATTSSSSSKQPQKQQRQLNSVMADMPELKRSDIPLAGVDFHCCPHILEEVLSNANNERVVRAFTAALTRNRFTQPTLSSRAGDVLSAEVVQEAARKCMWVFRSSLNYRNSDVREAVRLRSSGEFSPAIHVTRRADDELEVLRGVWSDLEPLFDRWAEALLSKGLRRG